MDRKICEKARRDISRVYADMAAGISGAFEECLRKYKDKMFNACREADEVASSILRQFEIDIPISYDVFSDIETESLYHAGWDGYVKIIALILENPKYGRFDCYELYARVMLRIEGRVLHVDVVWCVECKSLSCKDIEEAVDKMYKRGYLRVYTEKDLPPPLALYARMRCREVLTLLFLHFFLTEEDAPRKIYDRIVGVVKRIAMEKLGVEPPSGCLDEIMRVFNAIYGIVTAVVSPSEIKRVFRVEKIELGGEFVKKRKVCDAIRCVGNAMYLAAGVCMVNGERSILHSALVSAKINATLAARFAKECNYNSKLLRLVQTFSRLVQDVCEKYMWKVYNVDELAKMDYKDEIKKKLGSAIVSLAEEVGAGDEVRESLARMGYTVVWVFASLARIADGMEFAADFSHVLRSE